MNQPYWLMSPDGKLVGVQCGKEKILRNGAFEAFCEAAVYFLLTKLPRETCENCQNCNNAPGDEPHACPRAEEIRGDSGTLCTCCVDCTRQCLLDA